MDTGAPINLTADEHRAAAAENVARAEESFARSDTDGFVTQWASGLTAQLHRRQAEIEDNGGKAYFWVVVDEDGSYVPSRLIDTRYGEKVAIFATQEDAERRGGRVIKWIKRSALKRHGLRWGAFLAPAQAYMDGRGYGLSGTAWVAVRRADGGFDPNHGAMVERHEEMTTIIPAPL